MSVVECENALVQGFFDFTTETVNDDDAFRSIMDDDVLKKASQQSMISTSLLVAGASVEQHMLASHHPSVKQKQMKFLLKRLFRNNNILSLFNTNNSSSKVTPFYSFTSSIHYLATIEFSEIMMNLTRRTHDDANESDDMNGFSYRCKYLAELLLGAFQHQDVDAQPAVVDLTRTLLENPGQLVIIIMLYWSLERAHEANALLVQYCVAMISQCSPTHSFTADSDMEQEQARLLLYVQAMQNLQLILTTGRLVMADLGSGDTANTGKSISSGSVSDILFVRSVVSTQCVLDENIVMLLGITVRILLTFSCLRYRYDVVKVILEFNLLSPLDSGKEDDGNDGAASPHPRRRMSSMNHSPGMIALSKYWGMDTLISQLPDLTLPPPPLPPSPTHCIRQSGATPSSFSSSLSPSTPSVTNNDDDEVLLQQHIMNVQMHILQQEEKLVEDPGYQYFVDVCRDDCLHVSEVKWSDLVFLFLFF